MKYLYLVLCLLIVVPCYATTDTFEGQELTTAANVEGVTTCDTMEGQVRAAGGSNCPTGSSYQSACDGDYPSQTKYLCFGASQLDGAEQGTVSIGTDYGEGGSVGLQVDGADEGVEWTVTTDNILTSGVGTICARVYAVPADWDTTAVPFEVQSAAGRFGCLMLDSNTVRCDHYGGTNQGIVDAPGTFSEQTWYTIKYSWDDTNDNHEACLGTSANPSGAECTEDTGDTLDDFTANNLHLGEEEIGAVATIALNISYIKVYSTYQATCE